MKDILEEIVLRESSRLAQHNNNIICGGCSEKEVIEMKAHVSSLGIDFNLNMQKLHEGSFYHPVSIDATYEERKTVVKYCLATRMTTRFNNNGDAVYFNRHSVIEFMEYAKNLFFGKDKVKCKHQQNENAVTINGAKNRV